MSDDSWDLLDTTDDRGRPLVLNAASWDEMGHSGISSSDDGVLDDIHSEIDSEASGDFGVAFSASEENERSGVATLELARLLPWWMVGFLGEWTDSYGHTVVVAPSRRKKDKFGVPFVSAHISWNQPKNHWHANLQIYCNAKGEWCCGNSILDKTNSCLARLCWRSEHLDTEWIRSEPLWRGSPAF